MAIKRCLSTVTSFLVTFLVISMAFGFGMHFLLADPDLACSTSKGASLDRKGSSIDEEDDEDSHRFLTLTDTFKTLFWSIFDPGQPSVVGCATGVTRLTALAMWAVYNLVVAIVLLNILIALMNAATESVVDNKASHIFLLPYSSS